MLLHIPLYIYTVPPHSARSAPNRRPYLAQGLLDLRGPACCIITYMEAPLPLQAWRAAGNYFCIHVVVVVVYAPASVVHLFTTTCA